MLTDKTAWDRHYGVGDETLECGFIIIIEKEVQWRNFYYRTSHGPKMSISMARVEPEQGPCQAGPLRPYSRLIQLRDEFFQISDSYLKILISNILFDSINFEVDPLSAPWTLVVYG